MSDYQLRPFHCGISVSSIDEAVKWFDRVLGFKLAREADMSQLGFQIAFVKKGDFEVELFEHQDSQPVAPERKHPDTDCRAQGTKHICFATPDLDSFVEHLKKEGVNIVMGPMAAAGLKVAFIHGPDDIIMEFAEA